jgi:hypothetical protein
MKRSLLALSGMVASLLACGERRTEDQNTGAAVEDTTAAPSRDLGTPSKDTAADTGSEVRMRRYEGPLVSGEGDSAGTSGDSSR